MLARIAYGTISASFLTEYDVYGMFICQGGRKLKGIARQEKVLMMPDFAVNNSHQ